MSDKLARRYWQIHLSTAVVLMFAGGLLLWLNVREEVWVEKEVVLDSSPIESRYRTPGWPLWYKNYGNWRTDRLFLDVTTALVALILIAATSENLIRRRKRDRA